MAGQEKQLTDEQNVMTVIDTIRSRNIEVISSATHDDAPGLGWHLSPETEKALEQIDDEMRSASEVVGRAVIGMARPG